MKKIFAIAAFLVVLLFILGGCTGQAGRRTTTNVGAFDFIRTTQDAQIGTYLTVAGTPAQTNGIAAKGKIYSEAGFFTPQDAQIGTYLTVAGGPAQTNGIAAKGKIYSGAGFFTPQDAQIGTYLKVGGASTAETNGISAKGIISTETALKIDGCTITVNKQTSALNVNCP